MAEKINIAEFRIDVESVVSEAAETAKAIEQIKIEQRELVKAGKSTDEAFVRNAVTLRGLSKDYNAQLKVIDQVMNATGKSIPLAQRIDAALAKEAVTVEELRQQNSELTKARNQVNITTEEGQKQIAALNAQLDENNELIKENVSDLEQQKIGIGGYADGIQEALAGTGLLSGSLNDIKGILSGFTPILTSFKTDLSGVVDGFTSVTAGTEDMTAAQKVATIATNITSASLKTLRLALIATGIGAIVILLGSFVAYIRGSEEASNKFSKILGTLGGIVTRLLDYLKPLGEFLLNTLVRAFETAGIVATKTLNLIATGLQKLGFEQAAKNVNGFTASLDNAARSAANLADLENKLTDATRRQGIVQLQYQAQAEKLRQMRDDETLMIQQRIEANDKLGATLKEQLATESAIAAQALQVANLRIAQDGRTTANLDAQAEAMEKLVDINERVLGQESEQLTNRVSLQKEATEAAKEASQARIDAMNAELSLYMSQQSIRAQTLDQELALEQDYANRRRAIFDAERKAGLLSQTEYNTQVIDLDNDLNRRRAELAVSNLERELSQNENRIEVERALSKAVGQIAIDEERRLAGELLDLRAQFELQKFNQGITSETDYQDAVAELNQQYRLREIELDRATDEILKEQRDEQIELDFETAMTALEARNANEFEIRQAQVLQERELALAAARERYTDETMLAQAILNINQQAKNAELQIENEKNAAIWESRASLFGAIAELVGKETILGKAAAIAQATTNTYLGATKALATLPPPASYIAAAATIAQGLVSVGRIAGISFKPNASVSGGISASGMLSGQTLNAVAPFADGGVVKGGIPIKRSNGDNVLATLRMGEVVLNERQQQALGGASTFRSIGVPGFATGGLVGVQNSILQRADDTLVEAISTAVRNGSRVGTEQGSRQGISDLSTENYLRELSSF